MSDHGIPGLDPVAGTMALPLWAAAALAALFVVFGALAFVHAGREGLPGGLARSALVAVGAVLALFLVEATARQDPAPERRALEARASALAARAIAPGSPLACLDALAGDTVERSCERTLFASPEAMASAVSYVAAQLSLFADVSDFVRRGNNDLQPVLTRLRRAIETDRFGLVAHVLTTRHGCTIEQCPPVSQLKDARRVNANLAQRTYDFYVGRHSSVWPAPAPGPTAQTPPVAAQIPPVAVPGPMSALPPPAAAHSQVRPPGPDVFFPTPSSIPPVNIMTTEPAGEPETTGAGRQQRRQLPPPQSLQSPAPPPPQPAPQSQSKQGGKGAPMDLNSAARGAPPATAQ